MIKNRKAARALRAVCFLLLLATALAFFNYVLNPAMAAFYREKRNTVDVVFLGTSITYSSVVPALLWEEYGITAYNLSYPQQSVASTYYFLREFLTNQTPKVVVLEPEAFTYPDEYARSPENVAEMRYGLNMVRAVQADVEKDHAGYLLPFMRYHTAYAGLDRGAFEKTGTSSGWRAEERGYVLLTTEGGRPADAPPMSFEPGPPRAGEFPSEKSQTYLNRIHQLCLEQEIPLYLYKAPWPNYPADCMELIEAWAAEAGVPFRDYNGLAGELELENRDMFDDGIHMSVYGAHKVTRDLGAVLRREYALPDRRTDPAFDRQSWDAMALLHNRRMHAMTLSDQWDRVEYIKMLQDENYLVLISFAGDGGRVVDSPVQLALEPMGIGFPLGYQGEEGCCIVIDSGQVVFEQMGPLAVEYTGYLDGVGFRLVSDYDMRQASIRVDKNEQALGMEGINIVVYDKVMRTVVDRVVFSTAAEGAMVR